MGEEWLGKWRKRAAKEEGRIGSGRWTGDKNCRGKWDSAVGGRVLWGEVSLLYSCVVGGTILDNQDRSY